MLQCQTGTHVLIIGLLSRPRPLSMGEWSVESGKSPVEGGARDPAWGQRAMVAWGWGSVPSWHACNPWAMPTWHGDNLAWWGPLGRGGGPGPGPKRLYGHDELSVCPKYSTEFGQVRACHCGGNNKVDLVGEELRGSLRGLGPIWAPSLQGINSGAGAPIECLVGRRSPPAGRGSLYATSASEVQGQCGHPPAPRTSE